MPSRFESERTRPAEGLSEEAATPYEQALVGWLPGQRWFRSKSRKIVDVIVCDSLHVSVDSQSFYLLFCRVSYAAGGSERYFVPVCGSLESGVRDAFEEDAFRRWFASSLEIQNEITTCGGTLACRVVRAGSLASEEEVRLLKVEQSNTSLVVAERRFIKIYRSLEAAENPEVGMLSFLRRGGYSHVPEYHADLCYRSASGVSSSLALAVGFIRTDEDGWKYALRRLKDCAGDSNGLKGLLADLDTMGQRTGEMHQILASGEEGPFLSGPITAEDANAWKKNMLELLERAFSALAGAEDRLAETVQKQAALVLSKRALVEERVHFENLVKKQVHKIRIHGDFHLGQIMRPQGSEDWILFDFEGEPLRSLSERLLPKAAYRDVAGMLRSISYAVHVGLRGEPSEKTEAVEASLREAYLSGYFQAAHQAGEVRTLMPSRADDRELLRLFELEKAVYELLYELENRPDWVFVPLEGILRILASWESP